MKFPAVAAALSAVCLVPARPVAASGFVATLPCSIGSIRKGAHHGPDAPRYPVVTNSTSQTLTAGRRVDVVVTVAGRQQADDIAISPGITWPAGLLMESPNPVAAAGAATCTAGLLPPPGPVEPVTGSPIRVTPPMHPHPVMQ